MARFHPETAKPVGLDELPATPTFALAVPVTIPTTPIPKSLTPMIPPPDPVAVPDIIYSG